MEISLLLSWLVLMIYALRGAFAFISDFNKWFRKKRADKWLEEYVNKKREEIE